MSRSDTGQPESNPLDSHEVDNTEVIENEVDNLSAVENSELPAGEDVAIAEPPYVNVDMADNAAVVEVQESTAIPLPSVWQRVRQLFVGKPADTALRLEQLTRAIEDEPEAAGNYVLRGEVYMEMGEHALATADFQRAYEVAEAQFEVADWGFMEQAMRDRALAGLDKARRRLK